MSTKNYENVVKYLDLAIKNCGSSSETDKLKFLIKNIIFEFNKLIQKNIKRSLFKVESKSVVFTQPEETLKLIDKWIQEEKLNASNDSQ